MAKTIFRKLYSLYAATAFVIVVLFLFCPVLVLAPTLKARRMIGRLTVRAWLAAIFVPFRVKGLEHLPKTPCIVVSNHASYVDGIVLTAALPEHFTFLVQHQARDWPYVGLIIRRMGCMFVNRSATIAAALSVRQLIRTVNQGAAVAIFPEGSFRKEPGMMPFYGGVFTIASKTRAPVVPAVMRGTRRLLSDGALLPHWSAIEIEFFAPIIATGPQRADANALCDAARQVMLQHCAEANDIQPRHNHLADTKHVADVGTLTL